MDPTATSASAGAAAFWIFPHFPVGMRPAGGRSLETTTHARSILPGPDRCLRRRTAAVLCRNPARGGLRGDRAALSSGRHGSKGEGDRVPSRQIRGGLPNAPGTDAGAAPQSIDPARHRHHCRLGAGVATISLPPGRGHSGAKNHRRSLATGRHIVGQSHRWHPAGKCGRLHGCRCPWHHPGMAASDAGCAFRPGRGSSRQPSQSCFPHHYSP